MGEVICLPDTLKGCPGQPHGWGRIAAASPNVVPITKNKKGRYPEPLPPSALAVLAVIAAFEKRPAFQGHSIFCLS